MQLNQIANVAPIAKSNSGLVMVAQHGNQSIPAVTMDSDSGPGVEDFNVSLSPPEEKSQVEPPGKRLLTLAPLAPGLPWVSHLNFAKRSSSEEPVSTLVDYYISQSFLKDCEGNVEMLAYSIYKLSKYDCDRAYKFKLAYFNSIQVANIETNVEFF